MNTTRNGKIARLPKVVRDRLNQQMQDGVSGKALVRWLNGLPDVRRILLEQFNAAEITEQNLSEWRQGGYEDWLAHQERRDWVRRLSDEAEDVTEDAGTMPWMERVGVMFEMLLGRVVEHHSKASFESPEQLKLLLELSRELARHRHMAQEAYRWRINQKKRQADDEPEDIDEQIDRAEHKALRHLMRIVSRQSMRAKFMEGMSSELREGIEKMLHEKTMEYLVPPDFPGFADSVDDADPAQSKSIQPNPTFEGEGAASSAAAVLGTPAQAGKRKAGRRRRSKATNPLQSAQRCL